MTYSITSQKNRSFSAGLSGTPDVKLAGQINGRNPRVLLVDDDEVYLKISSRIFDALGIDLVTCGSIQEMMKHDLSQIDVALIDYDLGIASPADGLELATYIEECSKHTRVIVISSSERKTARSNRPSSLHRFCNKNMGFDSIVQAVVTEFKLSKRAA